MGDKGYIANVVKEQVQEEVKSIKEEIVKNKCQSSILSLEVE